MTNPIAEYLQQQFDEAFATPLKPAVPGDPCPVCNEGYEVERIINPRRIVYVHMLSGTYKCNGGIEHELPAEVVEPFRAEIVDIGAVANDAVRSGRKVPDEIAVRLDDMIYIAKRHHRGLIVARMTRLVAPWTGADVIPGMVEIPVPKWKCIECEEVLRVVAEESSIPAGTLVALGPDGLLQPASSGGRPLGVSRSLDRDLERAVVLEAHLKDQPACAFAVLARAQQERGLPLHTGDCPMTNSEHEHRTRCVCDDAQDPDEPRDHIEGGGGRQAV